MPQQVGIDRCPGGVAFGRPLSQFFFVLRGAIVGDDLFFLDLGGFFFQLGFGSFHLLVARFRVHHQLKNLVLVRGNFLLGGLDLVQQWLIWLVGFNLERLVAIFRDFLTQVIDRALVFAPGRVISLYGSAGL